LNDIYNTAVEVVIQEEVPPPPIIPPPLQGKSFSISANGFETRLGGCSDVPNATRYWSGGGAHPTLGSFIYTNITLTSSFNGNYKFYKIAGDLVIWINDQGIVMDVYDCIAGASQ
jgi:hypothetical protein